MRLNLTLALARVTKKLPACCRAYNRPKSR